HRLAGLRTRTPQEPTALKGEDPNMFNREFLDSKLGQAAMASVLAMTAMIALTTQFQAAPSTFATISDHNLAVELA
ncbi:MAG: hypothetical protein AAFY19_13480, partial [Pseudomonadota bacterium]